MIAAPISKNSIKRMRRCSEILALRFKGESRQQINCPTYRSKNRSSADSFTGRRILGASQEARRYVVVGPVSRSEDEPPRQANCRGQKADEVESVTMSS
jgi:hypothetical protein